GYKDKKDDQKNCFNYRKPGHFIADCPDLAYKNKGNKGNSKNDDFRSKMKKSLLATWEDLQKLSDDEKKIQI
ncbi:serine/threonine protein kinase SRPK1, partial [Trifolium medium]|nr:serine/threonine protein kinase SRPK1 [Trifolium medium]